MTFQEPVTEEAIRALVDTFYDRVREDAILAPVFERALHGNWSAHLPRMVDFWSRVLLGTARFQGNVFGKHMALDGITDAHFLHWLSLFTSTVNELFDNETAAEITGIADRIAASLQRGFMDRRLRGAGPAHTHDYRFRVIAEPGR
ncbi:MAG: group III truncated hemoglobin [Noviherbaspirillum sp.]